MENYNKLKNKSVETYTDDLVKAIQSDKGGLIKKIIHEEEKNEKIYGNLSPRSKKNRMFMILSVVLLILALGVLFYLSISRKNNEIVPIVQTQTNSIIYTDEQVSKDVDGFTKDKIEETVFNQVNNTNAKIGEIEQINLTENKKVVGLKRFSTLINSSLNLNQAGLISDNFLLGILNTGFKQTSAKAGDLFILLKVKSFTDVFPIARTWEDKMLYDLNGFFGIDVLSINNYLLTKDWQDGIIENKNARILYNNAGQIVLMYVFINDSNILITNSPNATKEVILRINSTR